MSRSRSAKTMLGASASAVALALVAGACGTGGGAGTTDLDVAEDDGSGVVAQAAAPSALAAGALSFQVADARTTRVTPDGISLGVRARYFEPARFDDWVAPDECAFNTEVEVRVDDQTVWSPPFEGPTATTDEGEQGLLGTLLSVTDPETGEPAVLALVVAFGQDVTVTLTLDDSQDGDTGPLDTQPADGWTSLGILIPGDLADESADQSGREVTVVWEDVQGVTTTEVVTLRESDPGGALAVLTDEWVFDESALGDECEPPVPPLDPQNQVRPPETDILSVPIGEKPTLPEPGQPPADASAATAAVLESIRAVYDMADVYGLDKADHVEDPALAVVILDEARANQVVEPFLSQLDPEFDSVVFPSPTQASVLYRVGPGYQWEIGRVLLIDGAWRVALGTICRDLADAMYTCPDVTPDPRPGPLG